jgi:hypothetical protein
MSIYCKENTFLKQSLLAQATLIEMVKVFQQVYRPEIYCWVLPVSDVFIANLKNKHFEPTSFIYDREESDHVLSINQALFVKENFIATYTVTIN